MQNKILFWLPRILAIIFILFVSLFALDVFSSGYGFGETIIVLFIHLVPSFILIIILVVSWKWEIIGGLIMIMLGCIYLIGSNETSKLGMVVISGPIFLVGILFIAGGLKKPAPKIELQA